MACVTIYPDPKYPIWVAWPTHTDITRVEFKYDGEIPLWETEKAPLAESLPGANATTRSEQGGYTRL